MGTPAWRINLLSAVAAAGTVSGVYLLSRYVAKHRGAAVLGSLALALSYTFWSQAVIAEVYTPGTLWWVMITLALWRWGQNPMQRNRWLLIAAALTVIGLGIHLYVVLIAPAALLFFIRIARKLPLWRRSFWYAAAGVVVGLAIFLFTFFLIDIRQSVTGYDYVAQYPSGTAWGVVADDLSTPWQRLYQTVSAPQWQAAMFPGGLLFMSERFGLYFLRLLALEFSLLIFIGAIIGLRMMWRRTRELAVFILVGFVTILLLIISYEPGDKHIFYLPSYVLLVISASAGIDWMIEKLRQSSRLNHNLVKFGLLVALLLLVGQHFWPARIQALADGKASFVTETYPYPVDNLEEPREIATKILADLPVDAYVLMNWRPLYAVFYLAHVEEGKTGIAMAEAAPYRTDGKLTDTHIGQIEEMLKEGRPVFVDDSYNLYGHFSLKRASNGLYQVYLRDDN
jgi:4-amino-4-deoxy-L-arabinose transferase-like glycosyltransferase